MATLENIRQKKNILAIVIGGALLAFIIEVGIEALGRQMGNSDIAKVGSEKIDVMTFQHRVEQASQADQDNPNQVDPAQRQQQVLDDMINEILLKEEFDKVGIYVSDNEISELMIGEKALPQMQQLARQAGVETPKELYDMIMNPANYNLDPQQVSTMARAWNEQQEQLVEQLKFFKLQTLMAGAIQANDLDRKQLLEEGAVTSHITFVKKDFNTMPNEEFDSKVTDNELRKEYNKRKPMFALDEPTRIVHFIALNVTPSPQDVQAATAIADKAFAALQRGHGLDSVRVMSNVMADSAITTLAEAKGDVKDFLTTAAVGEVKKMDAKNNKYVSYKLLSKRTLLDSVNIATVMVPGDKKVQDSVLALLNGGTAPADIKVKDIQAQDSQWTRVAAWPDSIRTRIENAGAGYVVLNAQAEGAVFVKVAERKPAQVFYTYGTVTNDAFASTETQDAARDRLQNYLLKVKNNKDFADSASTAGFMAQEAQLTQTTPQLMGIRDTRKAIKWAFENKPGAVSPIFSDNKDVLIAIALDDIYEGDYWPIQFSHLHDYLNTLAINTMKGEKVMADIKGKANDLAGYATLMQASVDTTDVVFARDMIAKVGNEPAFAGLVATAPQGKLIGPWQGENGVYVFQVNGRESEARQPQKDELDNRFAQSRGNGRFANPNMMTRILGKSTKVKKNIISFF
ncbi:MAG: SurA N-terminal domain-containing protein [Muribaculaceae bacterium]|nr:SurA N-terminal domain-containing protein [Muribaculaceae bacterium]